MITNPKLQLYFLKTAWRTCNTSYQANHLQEKEPNTNFSQKEKSGGGGGENEDSLGFFAQTVNYIHTKQFFKNKFTSL